MFLLLRRRKWDCWEQKSTFERNQQEKRACGGKSISINISRAYIKVMWATGECSGHGHFPHTCPLHMQTNSCISNTTDYPCNCPASSPWSYHYTWICLNKEVILILLQGISYFICFIIILYVLLFILYVYRHTVSLCFAQNKLHFTYFLVKVFKYKFAALVTFLCLLFLMNLTSVFFFFSIQVAYCNQKKATV